MCGSKDTHVSNKALYAFNKPAEAVNIDTRKFSFDYLNVLNSV